MDYIDLEGAKKIGFKASELTVLMRQKKIQAHHPKHPQVPYFNREDLEALLPEVESNRAADPDWVKNAINVSHKKPKVTETPEGEWGDEPVEVDEEVDRINKLFGA